MAETVHGWSVAIDGFDDMLHGEGKSPRTREAYRRDLEALARLLPARSPSEVGRRDLQKAIARLTDEGKVGRTIARMLSAWRRFFAWLGGANGGSANPCAGLKAPRDARLLPKAPGADRMAGLLEADVGNDLLAVRDRAMFELLYSSGLRLSELTALNVNDLDLAGRLVHVAGKGNKDRLIPVGRQAAEALTVWLACRPSGSEALFLTIRGGRLGNRQVQKRLDRWNLLAGGSEPVHPHMLRHAFASHVLQSSGDLRAVQELLGHADLSTTQIYTRLDFQHLARVYDATHPRARLEDHPDPAVPADKAED
ncbi:Site-specific recombinase XerC [Gulbenkiania indica]|uniref:Tyrosine recombinase XerC n=1 Tax=Gulbenkiania indica TaxID=375574 RepID=A0A0K6H0W0_9NEIS|nr:tyrosine recombinase XerC [Gulbenkiania indica]CUA84602.1 Site-specific recombinase XerC [Gulbenkiania indica]